MGLAELGRHMILTFKIFMLWASEDPCKRCEDPQCSVTLHCPRSPEADPPSMPTTHSAIGFTDGTRSVLAPVSGLAWLCIGISCKKTQDLPLTKQILQESLPQAVCIYHISYL